MLGRYSGGGSGPSTTGTFIDLTGDSQTVPTVTEPPGQQQTTYNYEEVLTKTILFYEAQRSGQLPADNRIPWRSNSALNDKGSNSEDLTGGGWYDAGDYVKFGFPMAFTTTMLAWGFLEWREAYIRAGQEQAMLHSLKWPLDYFIKCHVAPHDLYVQVGDGGQDHGFWGRPEDKKMSRPAYKITESRPGSDVAGETAAAMAAGYLVFKSTSSSYKLLHMFLLKGKIPAQTEVSCHVCCRLMPCGASLCSGKTSDSRSRGSGFHPHKHPVLCP